MKPHGIAGSLQFSADDGKLLVCTLNGVVHLCDLNSGKEIWRYQHDRRSASDALFSHDKKTILCGGCSDLLNSRGWPTGFVLRLDPKTGRVVSEFKEPECVTAFDESPDGRLIAASYLNNSARIRSSRNWAELHHVRQDRLFATCLSFSDDGRYLSLGGVGEDGNGVLMPLKTKNFPNLPKQQNVPGFVNDVQILGRQGLCLTASEEALTAWKIDSRKKLWTADDTYLKSLDVSHDRELVAVGGYDLTVREIRSGKRVGKVSNSNYTFYSVAFSHDGTLIAGGCLDCRIRIWSVADLKAEE